MEKEESLKALSEVIKNRNYNIEELVNMIPPELYEEIIQFMQDEVKEDSIEIQSEINERHR